MKRVLALLYYAVLCVPEQGQHPGLAWAVYIDPKEQTTDRHICRLRGLVEMGKA